MIRPAAGDPWNGFYLGFNGGGILSQNHTNDTTTLVPTAPFTVFDIADFKHAEAGGIFGLQAGWNRHFAPSWVAGVEVDWQKAWQSETVCTYACLPTSTPPALLSITDQQSLQWLGTARLRLGWLSPGGSLLYATGGLAFGRVNQNVSMTGLSFFATGPTIGANFGATMVGWTAGAGVETPITDKWSIKAEYLYVDLGTMTDVLASGLDPAAAAFYGSPTQTTTSSSRIHENIFRVGLNYHLDSPGAIQATSRVTNPGAASGHYNWNGFYGGIDGGGAVARNPTFNPVIFGPVANFPVGGLDSYSHAPIGGLLGGQIGWNWQVASSWFVGAEADLQWSRQTDSACISECLNSLLSIAAPGILLGITDEETMKWLGTARIRAGWIAPNDSLWYVTGGAAWGHVEDTVTIYAAPPFFAPGAPPATTFKHDRVGWTIGGGAEVPLWNRWSAKLEYLYVDLGKINDTVVTPLDPFQLPSTFMTTTTSFSVHDNIIRGGLNYHFN